MPALYDDFAAAYLAFVDRGLADSTSILSLARRYLLDITGIVDGLTVCDLACGEGHLSRTLAEQGASVTGIDFSAGLLKAAQARSTGMPINFVQDDAQALNTQPDETFDCVVSNLALMDIPDLMAVYRAVYRILKPGGRLIFSITHPCFQTPASYSELDENGHFVARHIMKYAQEGRWFSDNKQGVRGNVGAEHRMLSTYLNLALRSGFTLQQLQEPIVDAVESDKIVFVSQSEIPALLIIDFKK